MESLRTNSSKGKMIGSKCSSDAQMSLKFIRQLWSLSKKFEPHWQKQMAELCESRYDGDGDKTSRNGDRNGNQNHYQQRRARKQPIKRSALFSLSKAED